MTLSTKETHHFNLKPPNTGPGAGTGVAPAVTASVTTAPAYIAGISADGTHFIDQYGQPRVIVNEDCWNAMFNAGRWNGGDWQADVNTYVTGRAAQGYTSAEIAAYSYDEGGGYVVYGDSRDWDGTWPFTSTSNPSSGANETFWARRDYMVNQARAQGITIIWSMMGPIGTTDIGNPLWDWTTQQWADYGTILGNRFKNQPNVMWIWGDEINNNWETQIAALMTALRNTGDTHPFSVQQGYPTTSRHLLPGMEAPQSPAAAALAQYNWVYDYCQSYNGVIPACGETPTIPVLWGDGYYLDNGTTGGTSNKHLMRNHIWWALSSGACGFSTGEGTVYTWQSGSAAYITAGTSPAGNFYTSQIPAITSTFRNLPGWWKLRPDSGTLVTAGRGTYIPAADAYYYTDNSDTYVTVAWAADKSLAVIYFSHPATITVDQSQMAAGYTATWVDPASGATSSITPAATYNPTAKGNNSDGDADWVLILKAP